MIQWIALAVAANASSTASDAEEKANEAASATNNAGSNAIVIVRPVKMVKEESNPLPKNATFWQKFFHIPDNKNVVDSKPWGTLAIKKSHILHMSQEADDLGNPFVWMQISEYAKVTRDDLDGYVTALRIPGNVEDVARVIGSL